MITLNDDEPQTIKRMLFYLYTLDYPDYNVPDIQAEPVTTEHSPLLHLRHNTSTSVEEVTDLATELEVSEGAATDDPRMMNNVLVYAVAEKYDIPDLKALAKRKFQNLVESKWPHDSFGAIAESVFSTTPDGDMGLRQIVLDCSKHNVQDILKDKDSRTVLFDIEAVAAVVLDAAVQKLDQVDLLLNEALVEQTALRQELSRAKADAKNVLDQNSAWTSRLDSVLQSADSIEKCRHCTEKFNWFLERLGPSDTFEIQLRCASCRTRHTLSPRYP